MANVPRDASYSNLVVKNNLVVPGKLTANTIDAVTYDCALVLADTIDAEEYINIESADVDVDDLQVESLTIVDPGRVTQAVLSYDNTPLPLTQGIGSTLTQYPNVLIGKMDSTSETVTGGSFSNAHSFTLPANTLVDVGDTLEITMTVTGFSAVNYQFKLPIGTTIATGSFGGGFEYNTIVVVIPLGAGAVTPSYWFESENVGNNNTGASGNIGLDTTVDNLIRVQNTSGSSFTIVSSTWKLFKVP